MWDLGFRGLGFRGLGFRVDFNGNSFFRLRNDKVVATALDVFGWYLLGTSNPVKDHG